MDIEQNPQLERQESYTHNDVIQKSKTAWLQEKLALKVIGAGVLFVAVLLVFFVTAPAQSQKVNMFRITSGDSVSYISAELQEKSIIRSGTLMRVLFALTGTASKVKSGDYVFEPKADMLSIMKALVTGDYGEAYIWVTIPEGLNNREIARIIDKKIPNISQQKFVEVAKDKEGYLFPDTYHFSKLATEEEMVKKMNETFLDKTRALRLQMSEDGFKKAIIIASMLEDEAVDINDGRIISGVIQNRLAINMRLQIDATLKYVTGRGSAQLTRADLAMKSPYNTYRNTGLTPGPISNPGIEMITAAIYPVKTKYIYYLHAPDKTAYYAVTHDEHVKNKKKYLR